MTIAKECESDCVIKIYFDTKFTGPVDLYEAIEGDNDFEIYLGEKSRGFCDDTLYRQLFPFDKKNTFSLSFGNHNQQSINHILALFFHFYFYWVI